jgi:hypothetical protein
MAEACREGPLNITVRGTSFEWPSSVVWLIRTRRLENRLSSNTHR